MTILSNEFTQGVLHPVGFLVMMEPSVTRNPLEPFAMLYNAAAADHFAAEAPDRLAHIWILSYQIKTGRRWDNAREGFTTYKAAADRRTWIEDAYKAHARGITLAPMYLQD